MRTLIPILLLVAGAGAHADTVWRCGSSYSTTPCAEGRAVDVADPRNVQQAAEGRAVLRRERETARALLAERRQRESEALRNGSGLAGFKPLPKASEKSARTAADFKSRTQPKRKQVRPRRDAGG